MPFSDSFTENLYSRSSPDPILTLMRVLIDNDYYYYVNNNESIASTVSGSSKVYQPSAFNLSLPQDNAEGTPRAELTLDPADNGIVRRLRAANDRVYVTLWLVAASSPNSVEFGPVEYESTEFSISSGNITVGLEVEPILDRVVPARRFTPDLFPALWDREDLNVVN